MEEEEECTGKKRKTQPTTFTPSTTTSEIRHLMELLMQQTKEIEALRADRDQWKHCAAGGGSVESVTRAENALKMAKELHAMMMERANNDAIDANERAALAMKSVAGLKAQMAAKDKTIADQDAMLVKTASVHVKMMHEFEDFRANCKSSMEGKDQCIGSLKARLKTLQNEVDAKRRLDGASAMKVIDHFRKMVVGLNDILNNSAVETTTKKKQAGRNGDGDQYTPEQSITMAKAELFNQLLAEDSDAKLREDFTGEWMSLVNSCVYKAHNIDFRRVECGIVAVCSLFIRKVDPTYAISPVCASFGTTAEQVSERFTEMLGSEQSSGRFIRNIIEETLTRIAKV
jgi:hypothetical protein